MKRDGWITKCIGDCFEYIKNGANIKQEKNASGYPITRIETLANGVFNRDRMGYANIFDIGKYSINILQNQDILMSHINSKAYIGRSVIYRKIDNEIIIHGMNLLRLIAKKDFLNPYYANYYFKTDSFKGDVAKIRKDAVNQSSMAISDLSKIKMPIPPLPEQFRIVEELDQLSNIIEKKRQQLSELDNLAQSIFYDMFGDPVTNEKGWEVKKLTDVCYIQYGYAFDSSCFCDDESYPQLVRIRDIIRGFSETFYKGDIPEGYYIYKGDYLIGMDGEFNIAPWQSEKALLNQRVCKISSIGNIVDYFVYYYMRNILKEIEKETSFVTVKHLSAKRLNSISIPFPPLNLQQLFAQKIEAIEKEKELIKQSIKETEELFNSRMDYYFG